MRRLAWFLAGLVFMYATGHAQGTPKSSERLKHVNKNDVPWSATADIPVAGTRWRTLLGTGGRFGEGLPDKDLYLRQGEMDPGAVYPDHQEASPEAWYFIAGRAQWKVDGEEFIAEPGSAVYLKPDAVSSVRIISKNKADIVRINWGTRCDNTVLTHKKYVFVGNRNWPQTPRARLPVWDYAGDTSRNPDDGRSNLARPLSPTSQVHLKHVNYFDIRWPAPGGLATQKTSIMKAPVIRFLTLVGDLGKSTGGWGDGLPNSDILFGVGEMGSTAVYDDHKHDVPEFYYVVSGRLQIRIDGDEFIAEPGELFYHKPWAVHKLEVVSRSPAFLLWADWGINCDRSVLRQPTRLLGAPANP